MLGTTDFEKDLGVLVDNKLKFSKHVEAQVCKANRILGIIRSYQYLDSETMRLLFTAFVRPHLEFGNVAWSPRFQNEKKLIEGVLRRATQLVPGLGNHDYSERLKCMNLASMKYSRERGDMFRDI